MKRVLLPALAVALCACRPSRMAGGAPDAGAHTGAVATHAGTMALSADGRRLYVVNPDSDSVSFIDTARRTLTAEVLLAPARPAVDAQGNFTPRVLPRALALSPDGTTLYVTGERSGALHVLDATTGALRATVPLGSEPFGLLVTPDGSAVFAACAQDAKVVEVDARSLRVVASAATSAKPWALAWGPDGALLATHLLAGEVTVIDPKAMAVVSTWTIRDSAPRGDARLAHGQVRGLYDLAPRPQSDELWLAHVLLGTDTAQPALNFENTIFPALTVLRSDGAEQGRLSTNAQDVVGINGAFADVVSGPHALAFTADGAFALLVDTHSEDVLVVDAVGGREASLLRPLPGHMPEGVVLSPDEQRAYVDQRNSGDVAVLQVQRAADTLTLRVDGPPIARLERDPMPAPMRLGQHLFYSANSDEAPISRNHWVACASCHLEGRSDAVTWRFEQGPRDTPSNAGGMLQTGFLFRTADRNQVQDYWRTIDIEQGGHFTRDDPALVPLLDALADYVNHAIPYPVPPTTDPAKVARGAALFHDARVGCATCHSGPAFTDSGQGNPTLDLAGPVLLHDVGTCVQGGPFVDVGHADMQGHPRDACRFDTPTLRGVADSAPYLHDGSAATLRDVLEQTRGQMGDITALSSDDEDALVEYLRSL